jgi:hypothetical protein
VYKCSCCGAEQRENGKCLICNGECIAPKISIPKTIDFGEILIGESKAQNFTIKNDGNADLEIKSISCSSAGYKVTSRCPKKLGPSDSCTVEITFKPTKEGNSDEKITIKSNLPDSSVSLRGLCISKPIITIPDRDIDFGTVKIGKLSRRSFTIKNDGTKDLIINSMDINSPYKINNKIPLTIATHTDIEVKVTCTPVEIGIVEDTISIKSNAGDIKVSLTCTGKASFFTSFINQDPNDFKISLSLVFLIIGCLFGFLMHNTYMNKEIKAIVDGLALWGIVLVFAGFGWHVGRDDGIKNGIRTAALYYLFSMIVAIIAGIILSKVLPQFLMSMVSWAILYGTGSYLSASLVRSLYNIANRNRSGNRIISLIVGAMAIIFPIVIAYEGHFIGGEKVEQQYAKKKTNEAIIKKLIGEWGGSIGKYNAKLFIYYKDNKIAGKVLYKGVKEELSVNVKDNGTIELNGTSYNRTRKNLTFYLDHFTGHLSEDGRVLQGEYKDDAKHRGRWSFYKVR